MKLTLFTSFLKILSIFFSGCWDLTRKTLSLHPFSLEDFEKAIEYTGTDANLTNEMHLALLTTFLGKKREKRRVISKDSDDEDGDVYDAEWTGGEIGHGNWTAALTAAIKKVFILFFLFSFFLLLLTNGKRTP